MATRGLRHALLGGAAVLAAVAVLPAAGAPAGAAAPHPAGPQEFDLDDPAFFDPPNPIPAGEHGDLVRFQAVDTAFTDSWRIMYLSTTVSGATTVVTALVSADDERPPFGGYPVLLHGHGTIGMADHCAPSRHFEILGDNTSYSYDFESVENATNGGWVVVSTDFEGLGGPGRHPYLVGISAARSMLDAGLAARQIPGLYAGSTTAIVGFSQGGHAALFASQLAPEWTPQQPILGTVLAAPASDPGQFASRGANDASAAPLTVSIVAGLAASYPEAEAAMASVLTPAGLELATLMDQHCFDESIAMPPGSLVAADPTAVEPFASLLAANTAGMAPSPSPMLIFHAEGDPNVPLAMSDALLTRLCANGQVVERRVVRGAIHGSSAAAAYDDGTAWLTGLAAGTTTPVSSCTD